METTIIQLYQKSITTREISDLIEKMYGHYYSPQTVSNITQSVIEQVEAFHLRTVSDKSILDVIVLLKKHYMSYLA